jgi:uncharacterized protein with HXXEE motif
MIWFWWAPLGAASLHIVEEFVHPVGFADWDRAYRPDIRASITPGLHVVMNALLLFACFSVALAGMPGGALEIAGVRFRSAIPESLAAPAWLALAALIFSNAVFHVAGTVQTGRISPGVRTGVVLYMPMAVVGFWRFLATGRVSPLAAGAAALAGGSYHLWAALGHRWRAARGAGGAWGTRDASGRRDPASDFDGELVRMNDVVVETTAGKK